MGNIGGKVPGVTLNLLTSTLGLSLPSPVNAGGSGTGPRTWGNDRGPSSDITQSDDDGEAITLETPPVETLRFAELILDCEAIFT